MGQTQSTSPSAPQPQPQADPAPQHPSPLDSAGHPPSPDSPWGSPLHIDIPADPALVVDSRRSSVLNGYPEQQKQQKSKQQKPASSKQVHKTMHQPFSVPYSVVMDPNSGRPFYYPMGLPISTNFYSELEAMYDVGIGGLYYSEDRLAMRHPPRRNRRDRDAAKQNGAPATRNSVIISTFPDPQDDQVKLTKDVPVVARESDSVMTGPAETSSANQHQLPLPGAESEHRTTGSGIVVGGETILPANIQHESINNNNAEVIFNKQKESQYVTYIRDPPRPPTPPTNLHEEVEVTSREDMPVVSTTPSEVATIVSDRFVEVGEAEGHVTKFLIDEGEETPVLAREVDSESREMVTVVRSQLPQADQEEQTATVAFEELTPVDLVLCYDVGEEELAQQFAGELEAAGLSIWLGALADTSSEEQVADTARAVFTAQIMLVILSESSIQRPQLRDLISLATVLNLHVCPVAVTPRAAAIQAMSTSLKLQLTNLTWAEMGSSDHVTREEIHQLVSSVKEVFAAMKDIEIIDEDFGQVSSWAVRHQQILTSRQRRENKVRFSDQQDQREDTPGGGEVGPEGEGHEEEEDHLTAAQFWDQTFPQDLSVPWDKFRSQLRSCYLTEMGKTLPRSCMPRVMETLREGLVAQVDGRDLVRRNTFIAFCSDSTGDQDVWKTICDIAKKAQAVVEIFSRGSSVRVIAIDGIGGYGSPAVISALRDLMRDPEPVIRYLATVSLSRCMLPGDQQAFASLMAALDDSDWTVRRAACQAMARLGAQKAVDRLRRLWRNDTIAHVRAAAASALALLEIG